MQRSQTITDLEPGYYKVAVQGYYRDGAREVHAQTVYDGETPQQLAYLKVTGADSSVDSVALVPIHTYADQLPGIGWESDPAIGMFPDACTDAYQYFWLGIYKNDIWVEVGEDGELEIRVSKSGGSEYDWVVLDNFRLVYYGEDIPLAYALEKLAAAIAAAEALSATSTDAINTAFASSLSTAKSVYASPESAAAVAAAAEDLVTWTELVSSTAEDVDYLSCTIAVAVSEGLSDTALDNASTVLSTSTSSDEISSALEALRLARYLAAAETHDNVFSGNEPAAGDFYLYNVGQKRFFCGGDDWGAHAAVGYPGIIVTLKTGSSSGAYIIDTYLYNGEGYEYLNYGGYCDTSTQSEWSFVKVSDGIYNIVQTNDTQYMLGYNPSYYARVDTEFTDSEDANNQWILVTKDERDALLEDASEENPVDASHLIKMPGFSQREYYDADTDWDDVDSGGAWTHTNGSIYGRTENYEDFVFECWNADPLEIYQTITDLEPGYYEVTVQGYYRDGAREVHAATVAEGGTPQQLAYLNLTAADVDTTSVALVPIHDYADLAPGLGWDSETTAGEFPDACTQAYKYFWLGYYKNSAFVEVGEDGELEIRVSKSDGSEYDWVVLDNFRLVYYGEDIPLAYALEKLAAAIAAAEALSATSTDAINTAFASSLSTAKSVYASPESAAAVAAAAEDIVAWTELVSSTAEDVDYLSRTITVATSEGLTDAALDNAQTVLSTSTSSDEISSALESLRLARYLAVAETHDNVFSGNEPATGDFYLYNVGQKRFFCGGDDWGAHAAVGYPGIIVTLTSGTAGYIVNTHLYNGNGYVYLNDGAYCDTNTQTEWSFLSVGNGVYNIALASDNTSLLGYNTSYYARVDVGFTDTTDANNQWILVTKAERDALLADASEDSPVDASHLIKMPGFSQREYAEEGWDDVDNGGAWTHTNGSIYGRTENYEDFVFECWNADPLEIYQTITDLEPGYYEVTVQGYYRDGAREVYAATVAEGGTPQQLAYLNLTAADVDTTSVALVPIHDYADLAPGLGWDSETTAGEFPDACTQAYKYFWLGYYKNSAFVEVGEDGELEIRVSKSDGSEYDWVVLDNFRLVYYGPVKTILSVDVDNTTFYFAVDGDEATITNAAGSHDTDAEATASYTGDIEVPASLVYDGTTYTVTSLDHAFTNCTSLTSVELPATVTLVGAECFYGCSALTTLKIQSSTPATTHESSFAGADALATIYVPPFALADYQTADNWSALEINGETVFLPFVDLTVTSAEAATLVLPFDAPIPDGVAAYRLTEVNDGKAAGYAVTETLEANTPVFISAAANEYSFYGTDQNIESIDASTDTRTEGLLTGVYAEDAYAPAGSYVLQNKSSGLAFYQVANDNSIAIGQFRAYMNYGDSNAKSISFDGETTDITSVCDESTVSTGDTYTLQGVRVGNADATLQRGVYIRDGKKIVVK